jgi:hypothetical protein
MIAKPRLSFIRPVLLAAGLGCALAMLGQPEGPPDGNGPGFGGPPPFGPGGFGPGRPGGPGGFGGVQEKRKLVEQFDKDGDGRLNAAERAAAFDFLQKQPAGGRGRFGPGGGGFGGPPGGFGPGREAANQPRPGPKLSPADVKSYPDAPLYDTATFRTFFLEFEDSNWEKEMAAFKNTDIEMPAKVTVDGMVYQNVGVHFRGMSSFMMVGEGQKRSLNLSFDFVHKDQQIHGYRSLELLNSHEDPSFLRSVLSYQVERDYVPAPKANFVRVVINGESWGVFANAQPFNKDFVKDWFGTTKGARWKVPGSPHGQGSLRYLGDDAAAYKRIYQIKSKDDEKSWADLIQLCMVLNNTSADKLEAALTPILDIDGALKFLALENVLINNDGYWIRTSDYTIYEDVKGLFHVFPRDSNETFLRPESGPPGGPGGFGRMRPPGGPGEGFGGGDRPPGPAIGGGAGDRRPGSEKAIKGVELDPLSAASDGNKPLISKLLAVPALRARYLGYVRAIAEKWLDWNKLGPLVLEYHNLIAEEVNKDTRKLYSTVAFENGVLEDVQVGGGPFGGGQVIGLKNFADQRRAFLMNYRDGKKTEE